MDIEKHLSLVAVLHIALAALGVLAALFVFFVVSGAGLLSGDPDAFFVTSTVASAVAFFLALTSLPGILGAIGVMRRENWGRILLLIVSAFLVFHMPLGTLLAVYTFWVLLQEEATVIFTGSNSRTGVRGATSGPERAR